MTYPPPSPLREEDYEAIEAAVMETERGRWFLAEYARRNRTADTLAVLAAIDRLEEKVKALPVPPAVPALPAPLPAASAIVTEGIAQIEREIAATRADLATLAYQADARGRMLDASEDLETVVHATERATQEILSAAERIQEAAWTLREAGADAAQCDALDARATEIYLACSFQDLTGQRIARVVKTMTYVQERVARLVEALGLETTVVEIEVPTTPVVVETPSAEGPARDGQGIIQSQVDGLLEDDDLFEAAPAAPSRLVEVEELTFEDTAHVAKPAAVTPEPPVTERVKAAPAPVPAPPPPPAADPALPPEPALRPRVSGALALAVDPVPLPEPRRTANVDFGELAFAEKVALFS